MLRPDIQGAGGGGGSSRTPVIAPNTLRSTAIARIVDLVGEGEIYGFADKDNPLSCVYLNETPVANADGSLNFKRIQIDSRVGTQTQDPLKDFNGVESELGISMELRQGTPWLHTITNTNVTSIRVRLSVDALQKQNQKNGDVDGYRVAYNIAISTDSGVFVTKINIAFSGKTETKYERTHRIDLPPATTGWTVRVTRTTNNADSNVIADTTRVESITEIIDVKVRMPMSALVALIFDSAQFPQIPSRAYRKRGRIIRVPSNYEPETRTYTGEWDGTFQPRYSNNPAWVFYDLVTNKRYGLGHLIDNNTLDRYELYSIAKYCDVMVPDGFGGMEPRFTCNVLLQTQSDALSVVQNLATVFRGVCYASQGSVMAVMDAPQDSWYCYTPANTINGEFTYSGSDRKVRHTVALVSWNDMSDMCRAKIEYVEHPDPMAPIRYGVQETTNIAFGCTSRGQARRVGRYILLTETMETDLVTFDVGLDGVLVPPGKVIEIEDPLRSGRNRSGRIASVIGATVTLDRDVLLVDGDTLTLMDQDGKPHALDVLNSSGKVVTLRDPVGFQPPTNSVWLAETDGIVAAKFRVVSVKETSLNETRIGYTISAIQHAPEKFAAIENGLLIEPPPTVGIPGAALERPANFAFSQRDVADDNESKKAVTLSWGKVPSATEYNVRVSANNAAFVDMGTSAEMSIDVYGVQPGTIEFVVTARSSLGTSLPTAAGPYDVIENAKPPGFVDRIDDDMGVIRDNITQETLDRFNGDAAAILEAVRQASEYTDTQVAALNGILEDIVGADEWNATDTYPVGDFVRRDSNMYRALAENTNVEPGTDGGATWQLIGDYTSVGDALAAAISMSTTNASDIAVQAQRVDGVIARMPAGNGAVASQASVSTLQQALIDEATTRAQQIDAINVSLDGKANASAVTLLEGRVTTVEGTVTSQGTAITNVQAKQLGGPGINRLLNASFVNASTDGWQGSQAIGAMWSEQLGAYHIYNAPGSGLRYVCSDTSPNAENRAYPGEFSALSASVNCDGAWQIAIQYRNASWAVLDETKSEMHPSTAGDWQRVELVSRVAPAGTTHVTAALWATGSSSHMRLTLPMLVLGKTPMQFSDGKTVAKQAQALTTLDAKVDSQGNATATAITAVQVGINNLSNYNIVPDPNIDMGVSAWLVGLNPGNYNPPAWNTPNADWEPRDANALVMYKPGAATAGDVGTYVSKHFKVEPNARYSVSGYVTSTRAEARIGIHFYTSSGVFISEHYSGLIQFNGGRPSSLSNFTRASFFQNAPSNAATAQFVIRCFATSNDPVTRLARPMVVKTDTTTTPPWVNNVSSAAQVLSVNINATTGKVNAINGVYLDVNGYVSGTVSENNGLRSSFTVNASIFRVVNPAGGARLEWENSLLKVVDGNGVTRVKIGVIP